jgi:hypothetical protein
MSTLRPVKHFILIDNDSTINVDIMPGSAQRHAFDYGFSVIYLCNLANIQDRTALFLDKYKERIKIVHNDINELKAFSGNQTSIIIYGVDQKNDETVLATIIKKLEADKGIFVCVDGLLSSGKYATILSMSTSEYAINSYNRIGIRIPFGYKYKIHDKRLFDIYMALGAIV